MMYAERTTQGFPPERRTMWCYYAQEIAEKLFAQIRFGPDSPNYQL
jgi:hypothetical protein